MSVFILLSVLTASTDYDLVRIYHPDSPHSRTSNLPPKLKEERFKAIVNAYDILRGKKSAFQDRWRGPVHDTRFRQELERRRTRADAYGEPGYARSHGAKDDDTDTLLFGIGALVRVLLSCCRSDGC